MIYDIYIFSFFRHKQELWHMLPTVSKWVDYRNLYVIWDDLFPDDIQDDYTGPVDWSAYEQQLGHEITVINQSTLYDWHEDDVTRGWYRQQFAKMLLPTYATTKYNIICDSECMFRKPYTVFEDGKPILYADYEFPGDYSCFYPFIEKYLRRPVDKVGTRVGSCSMWDKDIVQQIWDDCYKYNGKDLIQCVREHYNNTRRENPDLPEDEILCFSEFETYGVYAEDSHVVKDKNFEMILRHPDFVPRDSKELWIYFEGMQGLIYD